MAREILFPEGTYFKSCHASTVLPLADGTVLAAYFAGDHEKADNVGIWLSKRTGGAWDEPRCIAKVNGTPHWNPVLFESEGGVRLVFKVGREIEFWKNWTMFSPDGGTTWTEPAEYAGQEEDAVGPVRTKPIMKSGAILAGNSTEKHVNGRLEWRARVDVSLDGGASFRLLAPIPANHSNPDAPDYMEGAGAIQPSLIENPDGSLTALLRTTAGYIFRSDSTDGGATWCEAYSTGLPNNNSGIDAVWANGAYYIVMNPVSGNWAARTPLTLYRSRDLAQLEEVCVLEDAKWDAVEDKSAEFSYPAMVARNGILHITYTYMRRTVAYQAIPVR